MTDDSQHTHCDNCGRPLGKLPPTAPHKRFCSNGGRCRQEWHDKRRAKALQALRDAEALPAEASPANEAKS